MHSQVSDVSVFGDLEEAARLLLPQASTVLSASVLKVRHPPERSRRAQPLTRPNLHTVKEGRAWMKSQLLSNLHPTCAAGPGKIPVSTLSYHRLLSKFPSSTPPLQVILPPKQTSIGAVELPPKNYYK